MDSSKVESLTVLVRCLSVGRRTYNRGRVITAEDANFKHLCEKGKVSADPDDKRAHLLAKTKAEKPAPVKAEKPAPVKAKAKAKAEAKPAAPKKAAPEVKDEDERSSD